MCLLYKEASARGEEDLCEDGNKGLTWPGPLLKYLAVRAEFQCLEEYILR
jgi:hypothetical protein